MKRLILCTILASISTITFASARVQIPVNQPIVAPHASSEISLSALNQDIMYNIICTVASDSDDTYLRLSTPSNGVVRYIANGNPVNSQMIIAKGDNTLEVLNFSHSNMFPGVPSPTLVVENLDNDGTLTIKQCFANPSTSK